MSFASAKAQMPISLWSCYVEKKVWRSETWIVNFIKLLHPTFLENQGSLPLTPSYCLIFTYASPSLNFQGLIKVAALPLNFTEI